MSLSILIISECLFVGINGTFRGWFFLLALFYLALVLDRFNEFKGFLNFSELGFTELLRNMFDYQFGSV